MKIQHLFFTSSMIIFSIALIIQALQKKILENTLNRIETNYSDLEKTLNRMETNYSDLEKTLNGMETNYSNLKKILNRMDVSYSNLNANVTNLNTNITNLNANVTNLNSSKLTEHPIPLQREAANTRVMQSQPFFPLINLEE